MLASRGALLSLADSNESGLESAIKGLSGTGHISTVVDVRKSLQVNSWIEKTVEKNGPLAGAVNLAGVVGNFRHVKDETDEAWDLIMGINATGVFNCLRAELNNMKKGGSIVSSVNILTIESEDLAS